MNEQYGYPLGKNDWIATERIKELARQHLALCDKAGNCGVNVEGQRQTLLMMNEFANKVQTEFFPNGSP